MDQHVDCVILCGNDHYPGGTKNAGPYRIATELRIRGYKVQLIDISMFRRFSETMETIMDAIISEKTLWLGISTTFLYTIFGFPHYVNRDSFDAIKERKPNIDKDIRMMISYVKKKNPKIKLISGGSRFFDLERFGFQTFTDHVDKEIVEFTDWCAGKSKQINLDFYERTIRGTEYKDFVTSQILYEDEDYIEPNDSLPIEISRGCIFKCKFCSYPLNGKTKGEWIKRAEVLKEEMIRNYDKFGVTSYVFSDDTYNDSLDKIKMLYEEVYSKLPFQIKFTTYLRLDLIMRFPEMVDILRDSGLKSGIFGIETLSHASGKAIGKGVDPRKQMEFIWKMKREMGWENILTSSGFILGLPGDYKGYDKELQDFLFSSDNPLDGWHLHPLFIVTPDNSKRTHYSEFDLEYEKYGYKIIEDHPDYKGRTERYWINEKTGLDFRECAENVKRIMDLSVWQKKYKYAAWDWADYVGIGVPSDDVATMSCYDLTVKYNTRSLREKRKMRYVHYILKKYGVNSISRIENDLYKRKKLV